MQQFPPAAQQQKRSGELGILLPDLTHALSELGDVGALKHAWRHRDAEDRVLARALEGAFMGVMNHLAELSYWALIAHGVRYEGDRDNLPEAFKQVATHADFPMEDALNSPLRRVGATVYRTTAKSSRRSRCGW